MKSSSNLKASDWCKGKRVNSDPGSPAEVPYQNIFFQFKRKEKRLYYQLCFILTLLLLTSFYCFRKCNCFNSFLFLSKCISLSARKQMSVCTLHFNLSNRDVSSFFSYGCAQPSKTRYLPAAAGSELDQMKCRQSTLVLALIQTLAEQKVHLVMKISWNAFLNFLIFNYVLCKKCL